MTLYAFVLREMFLRHNNIPVPDNNYAGTNIINYHINMGQSCFQPFPTPVFDCFQYVPQTIKSGGGEGLGTRLGLDSDP